MVRYIGPEDAVIQMPIRGRLRITEDAGLLRFTGDIDHDPLAQAPRDVLYVPKWALIDVRRVPREEQP